MTYNVWCYEQVCLAECFKLPKMLLANLLIARVTCWCGLLPQRLNWNANAFSFLFCAVANINLKNLKYD